MKNYIFIFALLLSACAPSQFNKLNTFKYTELLLNSEEVLDGLVSDQDEGFPQELLKHTKAIVVFPILMKAAVIAGARVGKGLVIVRSPKTGKWNPPAFVKSVQASWGIQAGIQEAELVLLVITNAGLKQLFKRQFSFEEGPQIAIGPVGKTMDLNLDELLSKNDILAYSRIKGLFVGLSFEGTVIISDKNANYEFYQQAVSNRSLLIGQEGIKVPESGQAFLKRMNKLAPSARELKF
jgi:SH3 domain-containing YSC84-like protein 1